METEKYRTGQKRIWAAIVDTIVFMPFLLIDRWLLLQNLSPGLIYAAWTIFSMTFPILYRTTLHYKYGQTIGKWAAGIKVLDDSENLDLTLKQCILRDLFFWTLIIVRLAYCFVWYLKRKTFDGLYIFSEIMGLPIFWWAIFLIIVMFTNSKRKTVHDFFAKTIVVRL